MSLFPTARLCSCGSGQYAEPEYDARGIYLTSCCDSCRAERLAGFRPEVLTDANYVCNEDVEPDDCWDGYGEFDGLDGDDLD
jgi:hypothetical protein